MRGERLTLGKTIDDVHNDLKISKAYIEAMEANTVSQLDRPEFAAGAIRSYAKYLGMDQTLAINTFKSAHGFKIEAVTPGTVSPKARHINTKMSVGFYKEPPKSGINAFLTSIFKNAVIASPLMLLILGGSVLSFFGFRFFNSIQELNIVPTESQPIMVSKLDENLVVVNQEFDNVPSINYDHLYARQALNAPVLEMRDGPIAEISAKVNAVNPVVVAALEPTNEPVVTVGPIVPKVELVPFGEAWVQVSNEAGDTLLEKLLKPGEVTAIPLEGSINFLKAGNATQLYVRINGEIFGPIGKDGNSVVKSVPLLPTELKVDFAPVALERVDELQKIETEYLAELTPQ